MKLKVKEIIKAKIQDLPMAICINTFIKDLYNDYNIYDNYLTFFDKVSQKSVITTELMFIIR
jgi:hypothetical protein